MSIEGFEIKLVIIDDIWRSGSPLIKLSTQLTNFTMKTTHLINAINAQIKIDMNYNNYNIEK